MSGTATTPLPGVRPSRACEREALAWRRDADVLADWALARLVNRTDVWGGYLPLRYRVPGQSKSVTRPRVALRAKASLTREILAAHFRGRDPGDVVGTHTTSPEDTSLWGMVDVDSHGAAVNPAANERAALAWYERLVDYGFNPLLTTSDELGGFHERVLFDRPVPTPRVYAFMRWLVADHRQHGVADVEIFPKQPRLAPGGLGNWARVPGRHHTRPVWAKAWDGDRWVAGEDAVRVILACTGDSPDLIPPEVVVPPPRHPAGLVITNLPERPPHRGHSDSHRHTRMTDAEVALACLAAIDNSGEGRHYDQWLAVGMVLHDVNPSASMLANWVNWSRRSTKHVEGVCERKWGTFGGRTGWTLGSLVRWAREAGVEVFPTGTNRGGHAA